MLADDELLDLKQVGAYLRVSRGWLVRHIQEGDLAAYRVGSMWRVSRSEIERFLTRNRSNLRPINHTQETKGVQS
jgi:excisionase family DNA binding protein